MKTLASHITDNLYKTGQKPRVMISIPDADLLIGAEAATLDGASYEDIVQSFGKINWSIDPYGGMAEVSGMKIRNLILDKRITLCTEASLSPRIFGVTLAAGRVYAEGTLVDPYQTVRDNEYGSYASVGIVAGRWFGARYRTFRGLYVTYIPAGITTCEDVYFDLTGLGDYSDIDFNLQVVAGLSADPTDATLFKQFTGWQSSGNYPVIPLNEPWNSSEYVAGHNYIRGNQAFRDLIVSATGTFLPLMILSDRDSDWTDYSAGPSGNEFVQFEASSALLKLRYNSKPLDNREAKVYLLYDPIPASLTGIDPIYTGVVGDYTIRDRDMDLDIEQNDFKDNPMLPSKVISKDDYPNCPEENIGKAIPILYGMFPMTGLHKEGVGSFMIDGPTGWNQILSYPDPIKGIIVSKNETTCTVLFAGHSVNMVADFEKYPLFAWNSSLKAYELFPCNGSGDFTAGIGYTETLLPLTWSTDFPNYLCSGHYNSLAMILPKKYLTDPFLSGSQVLFDDDPINSSIFVPGQEIHIWFDNKNTTYLTTIFIAVNFPGDFDLNDFVFEYWRNDDLTPENADTWNLSPAGGIAPITTSGYGEHFFCISTLVDGATFRTPMDLSGYFFKMIYKNFATNDAIFFNIGALLQRDASNDTCLYKSGAGVRGRLYGSWVDAVGRSNSFDENDPIENPAHIIESLYRDELGKVTADIDTAAFDAAASSLSDWKFAFQLLDREDTKKIISDLGFQCKSKIFRDEKNRITIKTFDADDHFAHSNTDVPGALDIITPEKNSAAGIYTNHETLPGAFELGRIDLDKVKNDFVLKYKKNYATNDYSEVLYCNRTDTNLADGDLEDGQTGTALKALCQASYAALGNSVQTYEYEAWAIRDRATAAKLLQYMVERMSPRLATIRDTTEITVIGSDLGDFLNHRNSRVTDRYGVPVAQRKKWELDGMDIDLDSQSVDVRLTEV
jgi:hypothetical protein